MFFWFLAPKPITPKVFWFSVQKNHTNHLVLLIFCVLGTKTKKSQKNKKHKHTFWGLPAPLPNSSQNLFWALAEKTQIFGKQQIKTYLLGLLTPPPKSTQKVEFFVLLVFLFVWDFSPKRTNSWIQTKQKHTLGLPAPAPKSFQNKCFLFLWFPGVFACAFSYKPKTALG